MYVQLTQSVLVDMLDGIAHVQRPLVGYLGTPGAGVRNTLRYATATPLHVNSVQIYMSRTSIPVDETTKERLDQYKRDDETWDEFLERTALQKAPIEKGFLSEDGTEEARRAIERSRESF
jgi:hypothetical protein